MVPWSKEKASADLCHNSYILPPDVEMFEIWGLQG